ncbi:spore coat protein SP85 [Lingula anatina]|uniref:Spore coat protein SP85 n=1 Tax=Lingula anatina TaxID=7574 RepID=A0A1S3IV49_LINAN|nr:spore coat protein SP85 [Lingula anatina]|eukprot:XP_013401948.1 spore coat protein SP85 [Lingula anatina]
MTNMYLALSALLCGAFFELVTETVALPPTLAPTDPPLPCLPFCASGDPTMTPPTPPSMPTTTPFWWNCRFPDQSQPWEHCPSGNCVGPGLRCVDTESVLIRPPIEPTPPQPIRTTTPEPTTLPGPMPPLPPIRARRCLPFPPSYQCVPVEQIIG